MKNTIYALGFLAAALIIVPNAAFGQSYDANRSIQPTKMITSNDDSINETDSENTRQSQNEIRSGSICSSDDNRNSNRASNRGALVSSNYNRVNKRVPQETPKNRVNEVLRSFCN
jgi:hypothetical protein